MLQTPRIFKPTTEDTEKARNSLTALSQYDAILSTIMVQITSDETAQSIMLPNSISTLLTDMLTAIAEGRGIVVMDEETELTTVQAADILKVSRPFLVGLLEKGGLPYRMVGSHRRVRLQDVLDYKENSLKRSRATLDELTAMAQEDGLYDL